MRGMERLLAFGPAPADKIGLFAHPKLCHLNARA
jgi:hypothetical protein